MHELMESMKEGGVCATDLVSHGHTSYECIVLTKDFATQDEFEAGECFDYLANLADEVPIVIDDTVDQAKCFKVEGDKTVPVMGGDATCPAEVGHACDDKTFCDKADGKNYICAEKTCQYNPDTFKPTAKVVHVQFKFNVKFSDVDAKKVWNAFDEEMFTEGTKCIPDLTKVNTHYDIQKWEKYVDFYFVPADVKDCTQKNIDARVAKVTSNLDYSIKLVSTNLDVSKCWDGTQGAAVCTVSGCTYKCGLDTECTAASQCASGICGEESKKCEDDNSAMGVFVAPIIAIVLALTLF